MMSGIRCVKKQVYPAVINKLIFYLYLLCVDNGIIVPIYKAL